MVSQSCINRGIEVAELLVKPPFPDGSDGAVQNVAGKKNQVGVFLVQESNPALQFRFAVVITYVQVAGQHNRERLLQRLFRLDFEHFAMLVRVMEPAIQQQYRNDTKHGAGARHLAAHRL